MSQPNHSPDPTYARSGGEPATSTDDAAKDQASQAREKPAKFVPDGLNGVDRADRDVVLPIARKYVAPAKPGDPDEVRRFMRPMAAYVLARRQELPVPRS